MVISKLAAFIFVLTAFGTSVSASIPKSPIQLADEDFRNRGEPLRARKALASYRELAKSAAQDNPEPHWKHAMACYFVGLRLTDDSDEKATFFAEGRDAGLKAISIQPTNCAACQFWTAINMALLGQTLGVMKSLFTLSEVKEHLRSSIQADPHFANSGAYRVMGLIEQNVPGLFGGSDDRAEEDFEKAVELSPGEPLNYLILARFLDERRHDTERAKKVARAGSEITGLPPDRLEGREALHDLDELLAKLQ
jgi:hypothetical protein